MYMYTNIDIYIYIKYIYIHKNTNAIICIYIVEHVWKQYHTPGRTAGRINIWPPPWTESTEDGMVLYNVRLKPNAAPSVPQTGSATSMPQETRAAAYTILN